LAENMPDETDQHALEKAKAFFERAAKVAQTGNFDYAIEMYLDGLKSTPDALEQGHLPLCELAVQRRTKGGKKPTMVEKVKRLRGKTPVEQMLNAEYLFAKDPDHLPYAEAMLKAAVDAECKKTAGWIANLIFQTNNSLDKPSVQTYILLKDSYSKLNQFDKALAACQRASRLKPNDKALADEFKNLSAELTMARGQYESEGDFRKAIKNRESQEKLHAQSAVVKTDNYRVKAVDDARQKLAQSPDEPTNILKLADALSDLETDEGEKDAISLLENNYKRTSNFTFKQKAGQINTKRLRRKIRQANAAIRANPDNSQAKKALEQLTAYLNKTEIEHYRLCVENYPTDLAAKYEYAVRLVRNKRYNEAIPLFQEAQKDPRRKIQAQSQIGSCFFFKGWYNDAIDVFLQAIDTHQVKDDAIGKELRYNLARAYEESGDAEKALGIYRKIAQTDFAYRDVSQRVDKLRNSQNPQ